MSEIKIEADAESKKLLVKELEARINEYHDMAQHRRAVRERDEINDAKAAADSERWFKNQDENIEINRGILNALNEIVALLRGKAGGA